ncbi:MAG: single-stranded DNA-binding protein [Lentisphaeria bacterium]|jgi:single-strand DNA-binding protein
MNDLNKVLITGNLVCDPECKQLPAGSRACELRIGVNRQFNDREGTAKTEACFVNIDLFGAVAEIAGNSLRRGSAVFIEGRLKLDQWEDKQSGKRLSRLRIIGEQVRCLQPVAAGRAAAPKPLAAAPSPAASRPDQRKADSAALGGRSPLGKRA